MTTFDDKERGHESKFAHDEQLNFKANARRNKLLGLWAAEKMDIEGNEKEAYAKTVVLADFEKPGDDDVLEKVLNDLKKAGVKIEEKEVREQMVMLLDVARKQIMSE